jgi:hypothetical protein
VEQALRIADEQDARPEQLERLGTRLAVALAWPDPTFSAPPPAGSAGVAASKGVALKALVASGIVTAGAAGGYAAYEATKTPDVVPPPHVFATPRPGVTPHATSAAPSVKDERTAEPHVTSLDELLPAPSASASARPQKQTSVPTSAIAGDSLVEEARLLKRAQNATPAEALRLTDEHRVRFPRGALREEREAIAAQALRKLSRTQEAEGRPE